MIKAKIIKNASYSPVAHLEAGLIVEVADVINEEKVLIRYSGYNYIIDKECIEYIELKKTLLKVRNGIDFTRYGFVRLDNGCWANTIERIDKQFDFSLFIDEDNILCVRVSNLNISHSQIEKRIIDGKHYFDIDDVLDCLLFDSLIDNIGVIYDMVKDDVIKKEIE